MHQIDNEEDTTFPIGDNLPSGSNVANVQVRQRRVNQGN